MPYVHIRLTGGEEAPTAAQKAELIRGVTKLLAETLGKNPATTVVTIEEIPMENWGIGGRPVTELRVEARASKGDRRVSMVSDAET